MSNDNNSKDNAKNEGVVFKVTDDNFDVEVKQSTKLVLVDFWAPWCGPCLALAPVLEAIAKERADKVKVCKLNVEDNPTSAAKFNIRNIPFIAFIKDGEKVAELVGNQPKNVILKQIDALTA